MKNERDKEELSRYFGHHQPSQKTPRTSRSQQQWFDDGMDAVSYTHLDVYKRQQIQYLTFCSKTRAVWQVFFMVISFFWQVYKKL